MIDVHQYRIIATLLSSGLSPLQTLEQLIQQNRTDNRLSKRLVYCQSLLQQGASFVQACQQSHLFNPYQGQQLLLAELAGKLPQSLITLANEQEQAQQRTQRLKAQLVLSQTVMLIALAVSVVLALFYGQSLVMQLLVAVCVVMATRLLFRVLSTDHLAVMAWLWRSRLLYLSKTLARYYEYYFCSLLIQQLSAGIDAQQAIKQLQGVIESPTYRIHVRKALSLLEEGKSLTLALTKSELILHPALKQIWSIGEYSGRLESHVQHYLATEAQYLRLLTDSFYTWLPRLYYALTLIVIAKYLL
ncbi:type II secretion system F family protein [Agitococcus lubricus]|uniref:Type II secretory pathway component PulF n=1 Tax=Agitococcus lubricus TaxID=1077255 RepID=A0A2T5IWR6_9GAMM|nr:type II secretion system F family protein [Agitococcus lubricus]PTQ88372.1 type II secretory pathway component PulF [Agitococcus lubricus]